MKFLTQGERIQNNQLIHLLPCDIRKTSERCVRGCVDYTNPCAVCHTSEINDHIGPFRVTHQQGLRWMRSYRWRRGCAISGKWGGKAGNNFCSSELPFSCFPLSDLRFSWNFWCPGSSHAGNRISLSPHEIVSSRILLIYLSNFYHWFLTCPYYTTTTANGKDLISINRIWF